jgi:hypothetical protein
MEKAKGLWSKAKASLEPEKEPEDQG